MLSIIFNKTKCDVRDCKNDAVAVFEVKGRQGRCFLCESCLATIAAEGRSRSVPRSPQNAIKKRLDRKSEEARNVEE